MSRRSATGNTTVEMSDTSSLPPAVNVLASAEPSQKTANAADVELKTMTFDAKSSPPKISHCPLPPPLPPDRPFAGKKRPTMIRVDGVDVPLREHVDKMRRKAATKSGVTEEARKVLEQFLKHSYGRGLTSPYTSEQNTQSEREYLDECPYMLLQSNESYYGHSTQSADLMTKEKEGYFDEPDYAEPAEPNEEEEEGEEEEEDFEQIPETQEDIDAALGHVRVTKANSVSSQSSFGMSLRSHPASRSRSPSERFFCSVHPPQIKGKIKGKCKKHKGLYDESSSSTEDYEYTEGYLVRRKKKSFFKWASERLRQSFRRSHNKVPVLLQGEGDSSKGSTLITLALPEEFDDKVKGKKVKKSKLKFNLRRHGSDKGSKSTQSSSTPNETNGEALQVPQELVTASESELASYCIQEDHGALERAGSTERRRKSPVPWKRCEIKPKKKGVPPSDVGKDKGIFDSFLRHIRKGSSKLRRKGSKGDSVRQRSCSADNLVLRPLSKEHERLLQRYTRRKEPEYDSDNATTHSYHESAVRRPDRGEPLTPRLPLPTPDCVRSKGIGVDPDGDQSQAGSVVGDAVLLQCVRGHDLLPRIRPSESEDDVDGKHVFRKPHKKYSVPPLNITHKPFHERTDLEKEELYEKIAEQLAAIADQYNFESPRSSKSLSSPTYQSQSHSRSHSNSAPSQSEAEEGLIMPSSDQPVKSVQYPPDGADSKQLQEQLGLLLRDKDSTSCDVLPQSIQDVPPFMVELVRNASYSKFKQIFNENIGTEPGWEQIAMTFRLTQTAVQLAGFGTAAALQIKEMTLKYFEDKFAGWIVGQGGWESVVEDTENDSELD